MAFGPSVFAWLSKKPASAIPYHGGLCKVETSRPASEAAGLRGDAAKCIHFCDLSHTGYPEHSPKSVRQLPRYVEYAHGLASSGTW